MKLVNIALTAITVFLLSACGPQENYHQAIYVLIDTSGTYTKQIGKAQSVVNYLLGAVQPGDSLAVARVKSRSFTEQDIVAKVTLNTDPLKATSQKRAFSKKINEFAKSTKSAKGSKYTDISGGLIQAAEFLRETGAGPRYRPPGHGWHARCLRDQAASGDRQIQRVCDHARQRLPIDKCRTTAGRRQRA